jgi:hypothetical protein
MRSQAVRLSLRDYVYECAVAGLGVLPSVLVNAADGWPVAE